ncbi:MAG: WbqC family protein [Pseudoruegeria sp.]
MSTLAIMQPTFLPWLGYFALIDQSDRFVFLDDVQFSKQSWQSRNRIKGPQDPILLSLGVARKPSKPLIKDVKLATTGFEIKLLKTVQANLGHAPYFDVVQSILQRAFDASGGSLSLLNRTITTQIASRCGLETEFSLASKANIEGGEKADRLLEFCTHFKVTDYLSPVGSYDYLAEHNPFEGSRVNLGFQNFNHPEYPQNFGAFQSHMAAIDALAHVGPKEFLPLIRSGISSPLSIEELARKQP